VGAGRTSRSARIATSSELLYLLNLLYNMPSECCVEYKLIQLYQKSSVWCFAFSHTSTFELIPAVAMAQPGAMVTECKNGTDLFYHRAKYGGDRGSRAGCRRKSVMVLPAGLRVAQPCRYCFYSVV